MSCDVDPRRMPRLQAYLVRSGGASPGLGGASFSAQCILDMRPPHQGGPAGRPDATAGGPRPGAQQQPAALRAEARWSLTAAADPGGLGAAWSFAQRHAASGAGSTEGSAPGTPSPLLASRAVPYCARQTSAAGCSSNGPATGPCARARTASKCKAHFNAELLFWAITCQAGLLSANTSQRMQGAERRRQQQRRRQSWTARHSDSARCHALEPRLQFRRPVFAQM